VNGEVFIDATEACNEVILKGADGTFSIIAVVDSWWDQLGVNVLFVHVCFEGVRAFVVEALELRFQAGFAKACMQDLVGLEETFRGSVFKGLPKNAVAIIVIKNH
jgi:hypothetical protein